MRQFLNRLKRMWRGLWVRDLDQAKWILNEIDEFLATPFSHHQASEALWNILSGLRGPDCAVSNEHSINLKLATTAHIRIIALPKTANSAVYLPAMFHTAKEFRPEAARDIDGWHNHFYHHVRAAKSGLEELGLLKKGD